MGNSSVKIDITASAEGMEPGFSQAEQKLGGLEKSSNKLNDALKTASATMMAVAAAAAAGIAYEYKRSIDAANEYQAALTGLASIARYAGQDMGQTIQAAAKLTADGLMSTSEAATALKNLLARGFTTEQAVEMINRFKDAAAFGRQSSLEFGQAVVSASEGIKNENSVLVDNAGVTKNVSVMWKEYADAHGISVNNLTQAQKRQAEYNGILKETEGQLGNAALAADGYMGAQARLNKSVNELEVSLGQALMPTAIALAQAMKWGVDNGVKPFAWAIEALGVTIGEGVMKAWRYIEFMTSPSTWSSSGIDKLKADLKTFGDLADSEMTRMAAKYNATGIEAPNIGKDSGTRRTDVDFSGGRSGNKKKEFDPEGDVQEKIEQARMQNRKKWIAEQEREYAKAVDEANKIIFDIDPISKANAEWEKLVALKEQGLLTDEQMGKAYAKQFDHVAKAGEDSFKRLEDAVRGWGSQFTDSMAQMVRTGKFNFSSLTDSIINDLLRIQIQKNITEPLISGGSGIFGDILGSVFGGSGGGSMAAPGSANDVLSMMGVGAYASGGDFGGGIRLVGERGPELELTGPSRIFNAQQTRDILSGNAAAGVVVQNNIQIVEAPGTQSRVEQRPNGSGGTDITVIIEQIEAGISRNLSRGSGSLAGTMERTYGLNRGAGAY